VKHHETSGSRPERPLHRWRRAASVASSMVIAPAVIALTLTAAAGPADASAAAAQLPCSATVTNRYPLDNTTVGIRVSTAASARVNTAAHFKFRTVTKTGRASGVGKATIRYFIGSAAPGYRVKVNVTVSRNGRHGSCSTWFTPRRPIPPTQPHPPAAWCTATASVYYAPYDENNVYVHSNRPYTDATASADGYSWGYETDGTGYAVIYLNGPPPGAEITVTIGGATCYTSD
jgi:hypothetical protein